MEAITALYQYVTATTDSLLTLGAYAIVWYFILIPFIGKRSR